MQTGLHFPTEGPQKNLLVVTNMAIIPQYLRFYMHIKQTFTPSYTYIMNNTPVEFVDNFKYL